MADAWILHAQEHLEASARQTALVKSAANTNTARANAERVQAAQEAKFCNSCNHPIYSCAWRVPSHARPGNLVRSGTKQPYWCACSAEDKARHFHFQAFVCRRPPARAWTPCPRALFLRLLRPKRPAQWRFPVGGPPCDFPYNGRIGPCGAAPPALRGGRA